MDSALKDMAVVMKQLNRSEEAIEAINSFRCLCSKQAQESLDNVLLDLFKVYQLLLFFFIFCTKLTHSLFMNSREITLWKSKSQNWTIYKTKKENYIGKKIFNISPTYWCNFNLEGTKHPCFIYIVTGIQFILEQPSCI